MFKKMKINSHKTVCQNFWNGEGDTGRSEEEESQPDRKIKKLVKEKEKVR